MSSIILAPSIVNQKKICLSKKPFLIVKESSSNENYPITFRLRDRDSREFVLFDQKSLVNARQAYDMQTHLFTARLLLIASLKVTQILAKIEAKKRGDVIPSLMNRMRFTSFS
jgi:hypothetical protein